MKRGQRGVHKINHKGKKTKESGRKRTMSSGSRTKGSNRTEKGKKYYVQRGRKHIRGFDGKGRKTKNTKKANYEGQKKFGQGLSGKEKRNSKTRVRKGDLLPHSRDVLIRP